MKTDLMKLYNTLKDVETKGESTKIMADCLRFIEGLVANMKDDKAEDKAKDSKDE